MGWHEYDTSYKERYAVDVIRKDTGTTEVKVYNQFDQTNDTLDLTKYVSTTGQLQLKILICVLPGYLPMKPL